MKKVLCVILVLTLLVSAAFANGQQEGGNSSSQPATSVGANDGSWTPTKAITWIVPYEAGGNSDVQARVMAKYMTKYSAQPVNIVNINGASGRAGAQEAMKAAPDGYTYLMQPGSYPLGYAVGTTKFSYKDFEMVTKWVDSSVVLVVNSKSGITTFDQFVQKSKANSGQVKMGVRTGTTPLFAALYLQNVADVEFNLVDLSESKAPELLSQRIDAYIDGIGATKQYILSGDFNCLVAFTDVPIPEMETIPTLKDLGYSGFEYLQQSYGIWAPKGTPRAAVDYVNNLVKQASQDSDCIKEMRNLGVSPAWLSVEEYTVRMSKVYADYQEAAKAIRK